jgi:hypothetical protein
MVSAVPGTHARLSPRRARSGGIGKIEVSPIIIRPSRFLPESSSDWTLLLANVLPVIGVAFFGWDLFSILFLYWLESAIIGCFNILKMFIVGGLPAVFFVGFFCFHYGMFMSVHLMLLLELFGGGTGTFDTLSPVIVQILPVFLFLVVSHGYSFISNFLEKGEYKHLTVQQLLFQPYGRIVIMHLTILLGGFLSATIGAPLVALVLMVVLKSAVDLAAHRQQHQPAGI